MNFRGASTLPNFKYGKDIIINSILDIPGMTGPAGLVGPTGPYGGPVGVQGYQGYQGYQGWQGWQGFRGNQGIPGPLGPIGPIGPVGPIGARGLQGFGYQGFAGTQGFQGSAFSLLNYGSNRILISTGAYNALGYASLTYDGSNLYTPNIYASNQFLGNQGDSITSLSYSWLGDTGAGFYHPATGNIGIVTNGNEIIRISNTGYIGIGNNAPVTLLDVSGTIRGIYFTGTSAGFNNLTSSNVISSTYFTGSNAGFINLNSSNIISSTYFTGTNAGFNNLTSSNIISSTYFTGTNAGFTNLTSSNIIRSSYFTGTDAGFTNLNSSNIISSTYFTGTNAGFSNLNSSNVIRSSYFTGTDAGFTNLNSSNVISSTYFTGTDAGFNNIRTTTLTNIGQILATGGSVNAPSYSFLGDTNNGIYSPLIDNIGFVTNGSEKLRIDNNGNVGIGTGSPSYPLDVNGYGRVKQTFYVDSETPSGGLIRFVSVGGGNFIEFGSSGANDSKAPLYFTSMNNYTRYLSIETGGNIGIGVLPGTNYPNNSIVQVGGGGRLMINNSSITGSSINYTLLGTQDVDSSNNTRIVMSESSRPIYGGNIEYVASSGAGGNHIWYTTLGGGNIERMRIISGGNVGIGTTAPQYKLDVLGGGMRVGDSTSSPTYLLNLGQTGSVGGVPNYRASYIYGDGINMNFNNQQNGNITFATNNQEYMRLSSSGNFGIGTTTPSSMLHVAGGGRFYQGSSNYVLRGDDPIGNQYFNISNQNGTTIWNQIAGNTNFIGGNVGINTTGPAYRLDVNGTIRSSNMYVNNNTSFGTFNSSGASLALLQVDGSNVLRFGGAGQTMFIGQDNTTTNICIGFGSTGPVGLYQGTNANLYMPGPGSYYGNVGINTTTPAAKLHVYSASTGGIRLGGPSQFISNYTYYPQWYEIRGGNEGTSAGYLRLSAGGASDSDSGSNARIDIKGYGGNYIAMYPAGNTEAMRVTSNGNVGIGTTGPVTKLDVYDGSITTSSVIQDVKININPGNGNFATIEAFNFSNSSKKSIGLNPYGGNVGINTTSPSSPLDINGVIRTSGYAGLPTNGGGSIYMAGGYTSPVSGRVFFGDGSGWKMYYSKISGGVTSDLFSFTDTGYLGIGTSSPSYPLDVSGICRMSQLLFNNAYNNIPIGGNALASNSTGSNNVAIGPTCLYSNTVGYNNVAIGQGVMFFGANANNNVGIGYYVLNNNGYSFGNVGIGSYSLYSNSNGIYNIGIGYSSLYWNVGGSYNVAIGYNALYTNSASNNVAVGVAALQNNTTAGGNTAIGTNSMYLNTIGNQNTSLGFQSLYSNSSGTNNISVGYQSLFSNTIGNQNVIVGNFGGYSNSIGYENVLVGNNAGYNNTSGSDNVYLGNSAGSNVNGSFNTAVGAGALRGASSSTANNNIAIGISALSGITSGSGNIVMGINAGSNITSGSGNIILTNTNGGGPASNVSNVLMLGTTSGGLYGTNLGNSSFQLGIGTTSPGYQLQLSLDSAAKPSTSTWTISSDRRIKENIVDANLDICYQNIMNVPLRRFGYNTSIKEYSEDKIGDVNVVGFIADEFKEYFPKGVTETTQRLTVPKDFTFSDMTNVEVEYISSTGSIIDPNNKILVVKDFKGVNVSQIIPTLVGAIKKEGQIIQQLQTELQEANTKISTQALQIQQLASQIENLTNMFNQIVSLNNLKQ